MPVFEVKAPDGKSYEVNAPEGATQDQAIQYVQKTYYGASQSLVDRIPGASQMAPAASQESPGIGDRLLGAVEAPASILTGILANVVGAGKGAVRGLAGGKYGTQEGVREAGEEARQFAEAGTYVPRSQTGRDLLRSFGRAFEESKLAGLPVAGAELPAIAQATAQQGRIIKALPSMIASSPEATVVKSAAQSLKPKNATLNRTAFETLQRAREAGYVVPPSSVNPRLGTRIAESVSGKIATAQEASNRNQAVTERLAKQALGLSEDAELTAKTTAQVRKDAYERGYSPVAGTGDITTDAAFSADLDRLIKRFTGAAKSFPDAVRDDVGKALKGLRVGKFDSGHGLDMSQVLREEASKAFRDGDNAIGLAKKGAATAIEDQIERGLAMRGQPASTLLRDFREARTLMAKSHSVEDALREGAGTIDAKALARQLQQGEPLSGELETIARFANTFEKANQRPGQVAGPGVHNLTAWAAGGGGVGGTLLAGPAGGAVGALAPFIVPSAARNYLLSAGRQNRLLRQVAPPQTTIKAPHVLALEEGAYAGTGLPKKEFSTRGLLGLAEEPTPQRGGLLGEAIDFPLRQEVLQQPEISGAIDSFRRESARLQQIADNAISPNVRAKAARDLSALQEDFASGMQQLGIQSAADAHGLLRPLYESGRTQLPIKKTFSAK